jgi:UDP-hydrolysing UDP-N-acetyl-D-glucosamine 2-epimerase
MPRKICVVVASRANYGRIKSVIAAVQAHPDLQLQLVVSASALLQRFGAAIDVIRADGFEPDATVYTVLEGETPQTMAKSTGLAIVELAGVFAQIKPDVVLTVADRYETMATAIAASYMNICLAHTQGGEVSGSIDESVRHAITKLSHIHFPATDISGERIRLMGEDPDMIFVTGCPSIDLVRDIDLTLTESVLSDRGVGASIPCDSRFILVVQHPVTTEYEQTRRQIDATIAAIERVKHPTIWLWPNVDAGSDAISKALREFREQRNPQYLHMFRNFPPEDFLRVLNAAGCVVGNTSAGIREAAYLGVPSVNIGNRQFGRERAENVYDVPHDANAIESAIRFQLAKGRYAPSTLYGDGTAGRRITDILATIERPRQQKKLHYDLTQSVAEPKRIIA